MLRRRIWFTDAVRETGLVKIFVGMKHLLLWQQMLLTSLNVQISVKQWFLLKKRL